MSTDDNRQLSHEQNLTTLQPQDQHKDEASQVQESEAGSREDDDHLRPRYSRKRKVHLRDARLVQCGKPVFARRDRSQAFRLVARSPKKFSRGDLVLATTNFSDDTKLGEGEFGSVYKGYLSDSNLMVAVKKIPRVSKERKEVYVQEMINIRTIVHLDLVELIGWSYSYDPDELLLVSEFMPNGSLHTHLFGKQRTLSWEIRYKTAISLASALFSLHKEGEPYVAHRDIKSSNVMFDSNFNAKLGEFGLNRLIEQDRATTMLPANLGYIAPEYLCSRRASKESDIFSFGVVALEIASGRKSAEPSEDPTMGLVEWIWHLYKNGRLLEAVDERLGMDFDKREMERLMIVGLWCAHPDYNLRPSISQVIPVLNFETEMPSLPNRMPVAMYMGSSSSAHSTQCSITSSSIPSDR